MRCVQELRGRFGKGLVVDVLRGSKSAKVLDMHLDEAASATMRWTPPPPRSRRLSSFWPPAATLRLPKAPTLRWDLARVPARRRRTGSPSPRKVVRKAERVRGVKRAPARAFAPPGTAAASGGGASRVFERLRTLRKRQRTRPECRPTSILGRHPAGHVREAPATEDAFLDVSGVGATARPLRRAFSPSSPPMKVQDSPPGRLRAGRADAAVLGLPTGQQALHRRGRCPGCQRAAAV